MRSVRLRLKESRDHGYSLTERLLSMMIFSILMALIFGLFITMTYQASDNLGRTRAVEQARLGLSQIDRQVRSGNLILNPAAEGLAVSGVEPHYSLRILTQEGGAEKCVQWRVFDQNSDGFSNLEFRSWDPGPVNVEGWSVVAQNLVGPEPETIEADDPESWPPFWVDDSSGGSTDAQSIQITLRMLDPKADADSKPIPLTSTVTGRNTVFGGYGSNYCSPVPSP
jgi:type II secretory pathway pseudopilin PulG